MDEHVFVNGCCLVSHYAPLVNGGLSSALKPSLYLFPVGGCAEGTALNTRMQNANLPHLTPIFTFTLAVTSLPYPLSNITPLTKHQINLGMPDSIRFNKAGLLFTDAHFYARVY